MEQHQQERQSNVGLSSFVNLAAAPTVILRSLMTKESRMKSSIASMTVMITIKQDHFSDAHSF